MQSANGFQSLNSQTSDEDDECGGDPSALKNDTMLNHI
jgi:hypothetical protein